MGSADLQSLADLGNSFEIVKGMKPVPFGKENAAPTGRNPARARGAVGADYDPVGRIA